MGTRSGIIRKLSKGTYEGVYCHWDGYPSNNGKILLEHWSDDDKLAEMMNIGSLSSLGPEIGGKVNFDEHHPEQCTFHTRDRGETESYRKKKVGTLQDVIDHISDFEYLYLWENKKWKVYFCRHRLHYKEGWHNLQTVLNYIDKHQKKEL